MPAALGVPHVQLVMSAASAGGGGSPGAGGGRNGVGPLAAGRGVACGLETVSPLSHDQFNDRVASAATMRTDLVMLVNRMEL
jgi:hypothetical protein